MLLVRVFLLADTIAQWDFVDRAGAVERKSISFRNAGISTRFLINLNFIPRIDSDGCKITGYVGSGRSGKHRLPGIPEPHEHAGIVVTVAARVRQAEVET